MTATTRARLITRPMRPSDVGQVYSIEYAHDDGLSEPSIRETIRKRHHFAKVIEDTGGLILGWIVVGQGPRDVILLERLSVRIQCLRIGIGSILVRNLQERVLRGRVVAHVEETNLRAQLFLRSLGFTWFETILGSGVSDLYRMEWHK